MQNLFFYSATKEDFVNNISNGIDDFIEEINKGAKECLATNVSEREIVSWKENAKVLSPLLCKSDLPNDVIVAFEYQIPIGGGRIDCMLFGHGIDGQPNIVHIEFKQWSNNHVQPFYDHHSFHLVVDGYRTGAEYPAHPSRQVSGYHNCLLNYIDVFDKKNIKLHGLAYCYNYSSTKEPCALFDDFYKSEMIQYPIYTKDKEESLAKRLNFLLGGGNGNCIYDDFVKSEISPTQRLYDVAARIFDNIDDENERIFTLLGEQVDVFQNILGAVKQTGQDEKTAIIVKGGPGTGKSVIALRLLSELYKTEYNCRNVYYATRSTSLLHGWRDILAGVARRNGNGDVSSLIRSTFDFKPFEFENKENGCDVLIVDEAHRIECKANNDTDSHRADEHRSYLSQIMSLLYTSRVSVFFIDDKQSIKKKEIGTSAEIRKAAEKYYQRINDETNYFYNRTQKELKKEKRSLEKQLLTSVGNDLDEICKRIDHIDNMLKLGNSRVDYEEKLKSLEQKRFKAVEDSNEKDIEKFDKAIRNCKRMLALPPLAPNIKKVNVLVFELNDQFRCNGSNNYLYWLDQLLYDSNNPNKIKLKTNSYEFEIYDDPKELYAKIRSLDDYAVFADSFKSEMQDDFSYQRLHNITRDKQFNQSARIIAGWCWDWIGKRDESTGDLRKEVDLSSFGYDFRMPWETKGQHPIGDFNYKYAPNADKWCNQKEGVNQVGCIHSIQGWETDYVGVIIGPDLTWDETKNCLCYNPEGGNHDLSKEASEKNNQLVLNTYRVLLTRGKKGCFVFACDPGVRDYLKRCLEQ